MRPSIATLRNRVYQLLRKMSEGDPFLEGTWQVHVEHETDHDMYVVSITLQKGDRKYNGRVAYAGSALEGSPQRMFFVVRHEIEGLLKDMRQEVKAYRLSAMMPTDACRPRWVAADQLHAAHVKIQEDFIRYIRADLTATVALYNTIHPPKKETTPMHLSIPETTERGDFLLVTVAIPKADAPSLRSFQVDSSHPVGRLIASVQAELPAVIELAPGFTYEYTSGHRYTVVSVGETEVVLRRATGNSAGRKGSRLVEMRAKVEADLRSGDAAEYVEPEATA